MQGSILTTFRSGEVGVVYCNAFKTVAAKIRSQELQISIPCISGLTLYFNTYHGDRRLEMASRCPQDAAILHQGGARAVGIPQFVLVAVHHLLNDLRAVAYIEDKRRTPRRSSLPPPRVS